MAVGISADPLKLALNRIGLSTVASKYIGEIEKP